MDDRQHPCIFGRVPHPSWIGAMLEVTNKCNLLCQHCCNASSSEQGHSLDTHALIKTIANLARMNVDLVYISGGEPFTRSDIFTLVQHMKSHELTVCIATNGTLLDAENTRRLTESGIDYVNISLDGLDEDVHDRLRGKKGAHKLTVSGIRNCLEHGADLRVMSVLTPLNSRRLNDFIVFLVGLGVKSVTFNPIQPLGRVVSYQEWLFSSVELQDLCLEMETLRQQHENDISIKFRFRTNPEKRPLEACPGGRNLLHITATGDVYPCSWLAKSSDRDLFHLGNVMHTSIESIQMHGLRTYETFKARGYQIELCRECDLFEVCDYGCPLVSVHDGHGLSVPDPICPKLRGA